MSFTSTAVKDFLLQRSYLELSLGLLVLRVVSVVLARLVFHPLRKFPGPRLAALTNKYQAYYEVWLDGGFVEHLEQLHAIYGNFSVDAFASLLTCSATRSCYPSATE